MIDIRSYSAEELETADESIKSCEGLKFYSFKSDPFRIYGLYNAQIQLLPATRTIR